MGSPHRHPSVTPQSPPRLPAEKEQHPLVQNLRALTQTGDDLQRRAAEFMLRNTVGPRWKMNSNAETHALQAIVEILKDGGFSNWSAFSRHGLAPYAETFYPTPPAPTYNMAWFDERREREAELERRRGDKMPKQPLLRRLAGARPSAQA